MTVRIDPLGLHEALDASLQIPPSKSLSHRAILCAGLANGTSHLQTICNSRDIDATLQAMQALGATAERTQDGWTVNGERCFVNADCPNHPIHISCADSASTLRFLIPLCSLSGQEVRFCTTKRLSERPIQAFQQIFADRQLYFSQFDNQICIKGSLQSGDYVLRGDVSSQFVSGLLFALPLMQGDSRITLLPPVQSVSYIKLTLQVLQQFGVYAQWRDAHTLYIRGKQAYQPCDYHAEGDYSQLAFFGVLAAIKGRINCKGMNPESAQGDRVILSILQRFGASVTMGAQGICIGRVALTGQTVDVGDCPDLGPILMVLGAFSLGETTLVNAGRLRYKESDRIAAMQSELQKLGVDIRVQADCVRIQGGCSMAGEVAVFAHDDHRVAMSLAVFALCAPFPVTIQGAACVQKSYPHFFEDVRRITGRILPS